MSIDSININKLTVQEFNNLKNIDQLLVIQKNLQEQVGPLPGVPWNTILEPEDAAWFEENNIDVDATRERGEHVAIATMPDGQKIRSYAEAGVYPSETMTILRKLCAGYLENHPRG